MSELCIWARRALTPFEELERVRLRCASGRISEIACGVEPAGGDAVFDDATLAPGLVDLQVNGGAGAAFDAEERAERERAVRFHLEAGTTSLLAALVSAPLERLEAALARLATDVEPAGPVVGIHLEGPFLAPEKAGAHDPQALCEPSPGRVDRLLRACGGKLRMVTLAPERAGALEAIERFARAGAVVAAGHSVATLVELRSAIARGLSFVTHIGNGCDWPGRPFDPGLGYRRSEPGLIGGFLIERGLRGSLILDGHHLHPELARALVDWRGPDAIALVSDATPAAGLPAGRYSLGGLSAEVHRDGFATAGQGLAGSVLPLLACVRVALGQAGLPLASALRMASATPAALIGLGGRKGRLAVGFDADLLLLGPALELRAVYRAGSPVGQHPES